MKGKNEEEIEYYKEKEHLFSKRLFDKSVKKNIEDLQREQKLKEMSV